MGEFDFIAQYLAPLAGKEGLGLIDDCAVFTPIAGRDLILTKDAMVEGVHFPRGQFDAVTASKLLRVNLSDLAAKGARPEGYLLSLALPKSFDDNCAKDFTAGLGAAQGKFGIKLWGGDTTSTDGPLTISATLIGSVPAGKAVLRTGAQSGDLLFVTGTIGDARLGLDVALGREITGNVADKAHWLAAYNAPQPRLDMGAMLRDYASAALDISDGLIADAGHLAKASGVALRIESSSVPLSKPAQDWLASGGEIETLLTGGDDYQVLFTAAAKHAPAMQDAARAQGLTLTQIGQTHEGQGVECYDADGGVMGFARGGWAHF
ncbi:MAG: thiamine-phosphate kinase [Robiginitomaculum sp.]